MLRWLIPLLLLAPMVGAQSIMDDETNTVWNQYYKPNGCCTTFGSLLKDDPLFDGSGNFGTTALAPNAPFVLDWSLMPALGNVLELDPAGTIDITVHLGGLENPLGPATGLGYIDVLTEVYLGDTLLASGVDEGVVVNPVTGFTQHTWSLTPSITTLDPANGNLRWILSLSGAANGVYISHVDSSGNGWMTLPILEQEEVVLPEIAFNATLDSIVLDDGAHHGAGNVSTMFGLTGLLETTVTIAANTTGLEGIQADAIQFELAAGDTMDVGYNFTLGGLAPGNYSVPVDVFDAEDTRTFLVNFTVLEADQAAPEPEPTTPGEEPTVTEEPESSEEEPVDDEPTAEESPGFQIVALLALLGAIAVLRRK